MHPFVYAENARLVRVKSLVLNVSVAFEDFFYFFK